MLRRTTPLLALAATAAAVAAVAATAIAGPPAEARNCAHRVSEVINAKGHVRREGPCRTGEYVAFLFYGQGHWDPKHTVEFDEGPETRTVWCGSTPVVSAPADDHETLANAWEECASRASCASSTTEPCSYNTGREMLTCHAEPGLKIVRVWIEVREYYDSHTGAHVKRDTWRPVKHGTHSCRVPLRADYRKIPEFPKVWVETTRERK